MHKLFHYQLHFIKLPLIINLQYYNNINITHNTTKKNVEINFHFVHKKGITTKIEKNNKVNIFTRNKQRVIKLIPFDVLSNKSIIQLKICFHHMCAHNVLVGIF